MCLIQSQEPRKADTIFCLSGDGEVRGTQNYGERVHGGLLASEMEKSVNAGMLGTFRSQNNLWPKARMETATQVHRT